MKAAAHLDRRKFLKRLGAAAALPMLAPAAFAQATAGALAAGAATAGGVIKILSCNIRLPLEEDDREGNGWEQRKGLCVDTILAQRPDVVCLQECRRVQLDELKRGLPGFASYGLSNPGSDYFPGNAILFSGVRFELITAGGFWLSETPHVAGSKSWDSARPRFVNWIDLQERATGRAWRVWNAHLDHLGEQSRGQGARLIVEAAAALPSELPQVLAGDFNADATTSAYGVVTKSGWTDTYAAVHGPGDPGFTFHRFLGPQFPEKTPKEKVKGKIDFLFTRGPVATRDAAVIRDSRNGRFPSDHYFVSATVALAG